MSQVKSKAEIVQLLIDLGKTRYEVADKLQELGLKGEAGSCSRCPIAKYLKRGGAANIVNVGGFLGRHLTIRLYMNPEREGGPRLDGVHYEFLFSEYPQLEAVYDFIRSFDRGNFSQLNMYK